MNRAVFLDRDGTINKDVGYLHEKDKFEYIEGAVEGLKALQDMGYVLVIVTNQSGIARDLFTEDDYLEFQSWIEDDLRSNGITIVGSYYCPHHPEAIVSKYRVECDCRKPKTGLFWRAASELNIDMDNSFAVGDKMRDLAIVNESGVKGFLVGENTENGAGLENITICKNLLDVSRIIGQ